MKKKKKITLIFPVVAVLLVTAAVFVPDFIVVNKTKSKIISLDEAEKLTDIDCAVILGAGVRDG